MSEIIERLTPLLLASAIEREALGGAQFVHALSHALIQVRYRSLP
jgi:hypothetical protein